MTPYANYKNDLFERLQQRASKEKAAASQRFFPHKIRCIGANAADIKAIIKEFHTRHSDLPPSECLAIAEHVLANATYSEEKMVAYGLVQKHVKKHYDDTLLNRFEYWLEHYADNWALVDDLCLKAIYNFLMARPHLIPRTQHWADSSVSWCRRASNVVWVKFIKRKIGKNEYKLDKQLIFNQCLTLLLDEDEYVQKSIGWLLKVTAIEHQQDVLAFLQQHHSKMPRSTIRYALEKVDNTTRTAFMSHYK